MNEPTSERQLPAEHNPKSLLNIVLTVFAASYNFAILIFSLVWIFTNRFSCMKSTLGRIQDFEMNENITYGLFLSGAMGGAFYCLRSIYSRLADTFTPQPNAEPKNPLNMKVWIFWYLYRAIEGGVLALILLMLVKSNLFQLQDSKPEDINSFYTLIGIGFLAGFGAHELIHKILEIIQVLFAKSPIRASNSKEKAKENSGSYQDRDRGI